MLPKPRSDFRPNRLEDDNFKPPIINANPAHRPFFNFVIFNKLTHAALLLNFKPYLFINAAIFFLSGLIHIRSDRPVSIGTFLRLCLTLLPNISVSKSFVRLCSSSNPFIRFRAGWSERWLKYIVNCSPSGSSERAVKIGMFMRHLLIYDP